MKSGEFIIGYDFSRDSGESVECVCRSNGDGTFTVVRVDTWKHDIDLQSKPSQVISVVTPTT